MALSGASDPSDLEIRFEGDRVLLDGRDVSTAIRTPEISQEASRRAADPTVRAGCVRQQLLTALDPDRSALPAQPH